MNKNMGMEIRVLRPWRMVLLDVEPGFRLAASRRRGLGAKTSRLPRSKPLLSAATTTYQLTVSVASFSFVVTL